jgi:hypothetical protein
MPAREETAPEDVQPVAKPKTKLGKIGGKGKAQEATTPELPIESHSTTPQVRSTKVGVIGGKRAMTEGNSTHEDGRDEGVIVGTEQTAVDEARQGRSETKAKPHTPRETSQERADRVRDELKRKLKEDEKAPKKKKRKF